MGAVKRMFTGPAAAKYGDKQAELINATGYDQAFSGSNYEQPKAGIQVAMNNLSSVPTTTINAAPQRDFRSAQLGVMNGLQGQINGTAPSVAQNQLYQAADADNNAIIGLAASQHGGGTGGTFRNAARSIVQNGLSTNRDAATLRAQEVTNATNSLAGVADQGRSQDIGLATSQAQITSQEQQQKNALTQQYVAMGLTLDQAAIQAEQQLAQQKVNLATGRADQINSSDGAVIGAIGAFGGAGIAAASGGAKK